MNKGFVSIVVIAIIGVVTLVAGGGVYGVYKYKQIAEEKQALTEKLDNRKDVEIEELQDKVASLEAGVGTTTEVSAASEEKKVLVTYYIKPETANVRPCIDVNNPDCAPIGQYKQNTKLELPFSNIEDMPEWITVDWSGSDAYLNKIVISEKEISSVSPMAQVSRVVGDVETVNSSMISTEPLIKVIDVMISNDQKHIAYLERIKEDAIYYNELAKKGKEAASILLEDEVDPYLSSQLEDLYDFYDATITFTEIFKNNNDPVIELINKSISFQIQRKKSTPKYITKENYEINAVILTDELDSYTKTNESQLGSHTKFLEAIQQGQRRVSEIESNIKSYIDVSQEYNIQTYAPTVQPYISPFGPLTIPKKTYCTISGTGINGVSNIVCN